MRAEAGADAIAQAAGRCNRENQWQAEDSEVLIFCPEEQWKAPPELATFAACMRGIVRQYGADLLSPDAITAYFADIYHLAGNELDKHRILEEIQNAGRELNFPFQTIADKCRVIESKHILPVLIPFNAEAGPTDLTPSNTPTPSAACCENYSATPCKCRKARCAS